MRPSLQLSRRFLSRGIVSTVLPRQTRLAPPFAPRSSLFQQIYARSVSQPFVIRHNSSLTVPNAEPGPESKRPLQPAYHLTFTCKPCSHRSSHTVTKQGYHHGTVLITCPGCKNKHVISDHLKIFGDKGSSFEDILQAKLDPGQDLNKILKKGKLGIRQGALVGNEGEEALEFWEDGTETAHEPIKQ